MSVHILEGRGPGAKVFATLPLMDKRAPSPPPEGEEAAPFVSAAQQRHERKKKRLATLPDPAKVPPAFNAGVLMLSPSALPLHYCGEGVGSDIGYD